MEVSMKVSEQAQSKLRALLAEATLLSSRLMECERTSSAAFLPSQAIGYVVLDVLALGAEAFQAADKDVSYWNDGFEGILYSLCREVVNSLSLIKEGQQHKLLLELKEVTTKIDEWHSAFVAA